MDNIRKDSEHSGVNYGRHYLFPRVIPGDGINPNCSVPVVFLWMLCFYYAVLLIADAVFVFDTCKVIFRALVLHFILPQLFLNKIGKTKSVKEVNVYSFKMRK